MEKTWKLLYYTGVYIWVVEELYRIWGLGFRGFRVSGFRGLGVLGYRGLGFMGLRGLGFLGIWGLQV